MRVLLLSAYDTESHRYWRHGLVKQFRQFDWTTLTLPPRFYSWRIRGNPLSWYAEQSAILSGRYDSVIATSMVDLATIKGLFPNLSATPSLVYFHENQFEYPENASSHGNLEGQMVNLYSAIAASQIAFNSNYNKTSFLAGVNALLAKLPDHIPSGLTDALAAKSTILPVPLDNELFDRRHPIPNNKRFSIVWNHRWEYDKAPERLYLALRQLKDEGVEFEINILGKQFKTSPPVFSQMAKEFNGEIGHFGFVENRSAYYRILENATIAVSTSLHEFQGLAILEAVAHQCFPLAPNRLAYPEFFGKDCLYPSFPDDEQREAKELVQRLKKLAEVRENTSRPNIPSVNHLSWTSMASAYEKIIDMTRNPGQAKSTVSEVINQL